MAYRYGERHQHAKLNAQSVQEIRKQHMAYINGRGIGALAKKFGVHESTIRDVLSYRSWAHVVPSP